MSVSLPYHDPVAIKEYNGASQFRQLFRKTGPLPSHYVYFAKNSPIGPTVISLTRLSPPQPTVPPTPREYLALIRTPYDCFSVSFYPEISWWREAGDLYPEVTELFRALSIAFAKEVREDPASGPVLGLKLARLKISPLPAASFSWIELTPPLQKVLHDFDEKLFDVKYKHKFGVIYQARKQTEEIEIFSNVKGSDVYEAVLDILAPEVELAGFQGFDGGLDLVNGSTGKTSRYTMVGNARIMFHVSTLLPLTDDGQQLERYRHIGNDNVVIVVQEEGDETIFDLETIRSQMCQVFFIITPVSTKQLDDGRTVNLVRFRTIEKEGVPAYDPPSPAVPVVLDESFVLNAQYAAMHSPMIMQRVVRNNTNWLNDLIDTKLTAS